MVSLKFDLNYVERLIMDSLGYIEENNCDAPLLGGFSGSVIELLGRLLRVHLIKNGKKPHSDWFGDFLEQYLQKYFPHKNILYRVLRCEGAHTVLAQSGVTLTCDKNMAISHLGGHYYPEMDRKSLIIFSPEFMKDLKNTVKDFFSDVKKDPILEQKCQETFTEIWNEGQAIIRKEEEEGRFKVEYVGEMKKG